MKRAYLGILAGIIGWFSVQAQDYHAIEGSPYAGSLGVANNPASILSTPYPWDLTIFSTQLTTTSNALYLSDLSYLGGGGNTDVHGTAGNFKRYAAINYNIHLLNARIGLGRKQAISFGANLRTYGQVRTGKVNYNDSMVDMNQFFNQNPNTTYQAWMATSSWLELYGTYSRTVWDGPSSRLNVGATLKLMRGISGAFLQLSKGSVTRHVADTLTYYTMNAGSARYGYSSNYDYWHADNSTTSNINDFLGHTRPGAAMDFGVEYLIREQTVPIFGEPDDYFDYKWKFDISLLDVGFNTYAYGSQSRAASNPKNTVSDYDLNQKFNNTANLAGFNDSLATIVNSISRLSGTFKVWNPARLVVNVDKPLENHFAVNANLSLNLGHNNYTSKTYFTDAITLATITPRWETRKWGAYLPIEVTQDGKVWIGGAVKAGPVLLGIHNWATVFSKNKILNGGFYLAITIRSKKDYELKEDKMYTCPKL